jgi:hypothetical protein
VWVGSGAGIPWIEQGLARNPSLVAAFAECDGSSPPMQRSFEGTAIFLS